MRRFNNCDKKHQLKRKYIFKPDLDDIIVYDGCSYWGENGADTKAIQRMDKNIFKLVVIYDFFYEGARKGLNMVEDVVIITELEQYWLSMHLKV